MKMYKLAEIEILVKEQTERKRNAQGRVVRMLRVVLGDLRRKQDLSGEQGGIV